MAIDYELLRRFSADRANAAEVLFAHRHPQATPDFHVRMLDLWRCADELVLIEAFRGAGKTTRAEEHLLLEGCFGNFRYGIVIGETYTKACDRLLAIDKEARTNAALNELFGGAVLARKSIENRIFFASGAMLEAFGWEQELQAMKYEDARPDMAYLDDIENRERVRDRAAVDENVHKFYFELLPAMDEIRKRIRFGQTRRAEDCMVTRFLASGEWLYFGVPLTTRPVSDPEAESNWPARYPMENVRALYERYVKAGMLSEFLQAYQLQATNPAAKPFKAEMLQAMESTPWQWMPRYVLYDPARMAREKRSRKGDKPSDRTGKVVVSRLGSKILVHESGGFFWKPDELINDLFVATERHAPVKVGVEKNSLDEWLLQPTRIEMLKRGTILPLVPMNAPQDRSKGDFIMGLQPFFEARDIVLIGGVGAHAQLVAEITNFPQGPDNVLNALAYALRMFAGVPMYEDFSGANIADAPAVSPGTTVFVGWNASPAEAVAVAVVRDGRRLSVVWDGASAGVLSEAVKTIAFGLRAAFPRASFQTWVPADTFDQWQRVALVPALREARLNPLRGEHAGVARGGLSERIRTVWRNNRLLMVDRKAKATLNALAAGYALPVESSGKQRSEPENGTSRLLAEALECMVVSLDLRPEEPGAFPKDAHLARNAAGVPFVTANPRARAR